ncbi:MAG: MAPEG family protein [Minicystis sp.]
MNAHAMLRPTFVLVLWTFVMWTWMYATRIPAIRRLRVKLDPTAVRGEQMAQLPPEVRWKADNYNHLFEQPTLFYAVTLALAVLGGGGPLEVGLAWAYVALRVVHSLVQSLVNKIELRFVIFALSSLVLLTLAIRGALLVG